MTDTQNNFFENPFKVTVIGRTRDTFTSLEAVIKYIRLFAKSELTVFGPPKCFDLSGFIKQSSKMYIANGERKKQFMGDG